MRRFIAHIGAAKTGTTAFQSWLKSHRAELMNAGFLVPEKTPRLGNHRNVVLALAGQGGHPNAAAIRTATLREFADRPDLDILVSAEAMSSAEHTSSLLPALTDALSGFERVAVLGVRDQIAHYNSGFAQRRKAMRRNERDFDAFLRDQLAKGRGDWRALVEQYEAHGWRVAVIPYAAEAKARGVARMILSRPEFGGAADRVPVDDVEQGNPSMGAIGLIVMDLIQDAVDPEAVRDTMAPAALRERVARIANDRLDDAPFNGFTEETRAEVLARFAEANRWIADRFFEAPWDAACPPMPVAPRSPRSLADLPEKKAARVAKIAERMTTYALELGRLDRRPQATGSPEEA